jgi:hypothetical protein
MLLYPDPFYRGQWGYCKECNKSGDMLNIAAAVWDVDESTAAKQFLVWKIIQEYKYFDRALEIYQKKCLKPRIKHNEFWEKSKNSPLVMESGIIRDTLSQLKVNVPNNISRWRSGLGRLVGFSTKRESEIAIANHHGFDVDINQAARDAGEGRVFIGKWSDLLVIPYFDLPGRIREFSFISCEDGVLKKAHKCLTHKKVIEKNASIAFLDTLVKETNEDSLVVTDNLETALLLHSRNFTDSADVLPLVVMNDLTEVHLLRSLSNYKFTVCNPKLSCDMFKALKSSNVSVCLGSDHPFVSESIVTRLSSRNWLEGAKAKSRPVIHILNDWVKTANNIEAQATVGTLEFTQEELNDIQEGVYPELFRVISNLPDYLGKCVKIQGEDYIANSEGWFHRKTGRLISSARIEIDVIAVSKKSTRMMGSIYYQGKKIIFSDSGEHIQKKTYEFLRNKIHMENLKFSGVDKDYEEVIYEMAMTLSNSLTITDFEDVGWEKDNNLFRFYCACVDLQGNIINNRYQFTKATIFPTKTLSAEEISPDEFELLTENTPTRAAIWAISAAVVSAIIAPAIGSHKKRFAYYGQTAAAADTVCRWLGLTCDSFKESALESDSWPAVLPYRNRKDSLKEPFGMWFSARSKPSCLVEVSEKEAYMLRLLEPWSVMELELGSTSSQLQLPTNKIIIQFMSWMLKKFKLDLPDEEDLTLRVLEAMHQWAVDNGIRTRVFSSARNCFKVNSINSAENKLACFGKICCEGIYDRTLSAATALNKSVHLTETVAAVQKKKFFDCMRQSTFLMLEDAQLEQTFDQLFPNLSANGFDREEFFIVPRDTWEALTVNVKTDSVFKLRGNYA